MKKIFLILSLLFYSFSVEANMGMDYLLSQADNPGQVDEFTINMAMMMADKNKDSKVSQAEASDLVSTLYDLSGEEHKSQITKLDLLNEVGKEFHKHDFNGDGYLTSYDKNVYLGKE